MTSVSATRSIRSLDLGHPLAVAEEHRVLRLRLQLLAQRRDFAAQLVLLQRVGERHFEVGFVERLADEVGRAELHRLDDGRGAALAREHDDRHVAIDLLERRERRRARPCSPGITTSRITAAGRSA